MAYIQIEANVRTHRKFLKAGPSASWLWVCGLGYCQEGLTNGHIPSSALNFLGVPAAKVQKLAERLVDCQLWDKVRDGWQIHDYLEHNKSAEQVRATMRRRAEAGNLGGRPKGNHEGLPPKNWKVNHDGYPAEKPKVSKDENHPENPILPSDLPSFRPTEKDLVNQRSVVREDRSLEKDQDLPPLTRRLIFAGERE